MEFESQFFYGKNKQDPRYSFFCYYECLCKQKALFLKELYSFQFIKTEMIGNLYIACEFKNNTTGILIDYDRREGLYVRIVELKNNEIGSYDPKRWHYVNKLVPKNLASSKLIKEDCSSLDNGYIETAIDCNINILKQYGDAVLRGDFTVFKKRE